MAGFIPKEQLAAYTHWQIESFDAAPAPLSPVVEAEPEVLNANPAEMMPQGYPLPTAEELEHIHAEAHDTGYQAGYETGQQEGQQAGYEAGYQAGVDAAHADMAPLGEQMQHLVAELQVALSGMDQGIADTLLSLSLALTQQMVKTALEARPELLIPVIREALSVLPLQQQGLQLYVNPVNLEMVRAYLGEQFAQSGWRIIEDGQIEPGGCLIRAGSSEIDGTIQTRWQRVLASIGIQRDWLNRHPLAALQPAQSPDDNPTAQQP